MGFFDLFRRKAQQQGTQRSPVASTSVSPSVPIRRKATSLELPVEFDGKTSYRDMFKTRTPERLRQMCAELPIEALNLERPGISAEMGRAITQVFAVCTYMATTEVPAEFGDAALPRLAAKIAEYRGADLHLELCDLVRDLAIHLAAGGRHHDAIAVLRVLLGSMFWRTFTQGDLCLFASLNNVALATGTADDLAAAVEAAANVPPDQLKQLGNAVETLKEKLKVKRSEPNAPSPAAASNWKCPKCGAVHKKGVGSILAELGASVVGTVTCANCKSEYSQAAITRGQMDTTEAPVGHQLTRVDSALNFFAGERAASWGAGHSMAFNDDYTLLDVKWLLDGDLFPVSRSLSEAECRKFVEGAFPSALDVLTRSSKEFKRPAPERSDAYGLVITKLQLSYAVRHNVPFLEAVAVFKRTMGWK